MMTNEGGYMLRCSINNLDGGFSFIDSPRGGKYSVCEGDIDTTSVDDCFRDLLKSSLYTSIQFALSVIDGDKEISGMFICTHKVGNIFHVSSVGALTMTEVQQEEV